jgi:hypothetical protein
MEKQAIHHVGLGIVNEFCNNQKMSRIYYNRRRFMKLSTTAAVGGAAALSGIAFPMEVMAQHTSEKTIRLGFIGMGEHGSRHLNAALGIEGIEVPAICDIIPELLQQAKKRIEEAGLPTPRLYDKGPTDFKRLCETENLDAVICSASREWHAPICLAAMKNNKHSVSEVPIVSSFDEAWELVETSESTGKWATIGLEGFSDLALLNMIYKGMLGNIVHAEAGVIHDWFPSMDVNHGDRIDFLVSMSSTGNLPDNIAPGNYNASLMRTVKGKMITLNHDTSTPHQREFYRIQGTKGVFLGDRYSKKIYIEGLSAAEHQWESADKYLEENEHPIMKNYKLLHGENGTLNVHRSEDIQTTLRWYRLIETLRKDKMPDWDVYDSVTRSAIPAITAASAANRSKPVDFPDFTKGKWESRGKMMLL